MMALLMVGWWAVNSVVTMGVNLEDTLVDWTVDLTELLRAETKVA